MQTSIQKIIIQYFRWTRSSYYLLSGFLVLIFLIGYIWWPLLVEYLSTYNPNLPWWVQMDYLLLGNFLVMTLLIMAGADIRKDWLIVFVGFFGGLTIEAWGTQTWLWSYYTFERPPLWIIPAWPIASLSIDRLYRFVEILVKRIPERVFRFLYWPVFTAFYILMLQFVFPTIDKSLTIMALFLCAFIILTPVNYRTQLLVFAAGVGLGYFLERWGTTRQCWTYYTLETPPFFAVLAHGMAAVAFWRVMHLYRVFKPRVFPHLQTFKSGQPF